MVQKLVVGVDPSSKKLAIAVGTDDGSVLRVETYRLPVTRLAACAAAFAIGVQIGSLPHLRRVALEAPVVGRGGIGGTLPQTFVSGAFQAGLGQRSNLHVVLVVPPSWKKIVCGKGNLDKPGIMAWSLNEHPDWKKFIGEDKPDQDVADALCIYLYGVRHLQTTRKLAQLKTVPKRGTRRAATR